MAKVSHQDLDTLIEGLEDCKRRGIIDPWMLSDGTTIEPLEVLKELKELRKQIEEYEQK